MNPNSLEKLTNSQFSLLLDASSIGFVFQTKKLAVLAEQDVRLLTMALDNLTHFVVPLSEDKEEYCFKDTELFQTFQLFASPTSLNGIDNQLSAKLVQYYQAKHQHWHQKHTQLISQIENHTDNLTDIIKNPYIQTGDLSKALSKITETISKVIDVTRVSIWRYVQAEGYIECLDLYEKVYERHSQGTLLYQKDFPSYFKALEEGVVIDADNAHTNFYTREFSEVYLTPLQIYSMLDVPFYVEGTLSGVICFEHQFYFRKWKPEEIMFTTSVCAVLSVSYQSLLIKQREQEILKNNQLLLEQKLEMENARNELLVQNEEIMQSQEEIMSQREFIEKQNAEFKRVNEKLQKGEDILKKSFLTQKEQEKKLKEQNAALQAQQAEITAQNEELNQQQEELEAINESLLMKNELIEEQRYELHKQYSILEAQQKQLKETTNRLNKSITYAQNIQNVVLPESEDIRAFFADYFSIYKPKDIVSGDFYWFHQIDKQRAIFILADCTGHGVAGAFMSMVGNSLLYKLIKIKGLHDPAAILTNIHHDIFVLLKQESGKNKDGMDISICLFEKQEIQTQVTFAGAKSMIIYAKEETCTLLVGDRISIGGLSNKQRAFTNQQFYLSQGDKIYFFSDGYIDQNDAQRQRFSTNRFQELIYSIHSLALYEQEAKLLKILQEYQGNEEQRDDISVIGLKL